MTMEPMTPALPPTPTRTGQQTHVEQARAVAEVASVVQVAQTFRRDIEDARREMIRECSEFKTADGAIFRYSRGGKTVTGPTVKLARALKRCFGNFQSGWSELRRDDEYGQSELQAWAWDVERNSRSVVTFVVPHKNYYTGTNLDALRDIYEGNANQGSRREREQILGLLPAWFVEEALQACRDTLIRGNGEPLVVRQDKAEGVFKAIGIDLARLERKVGRVKAQWSPMDLADLTVDYQSIRSGEIPAEELFPPTTITDEDLPPQQQPGGRVPEPVKWSQPVTVTREQVGPPPADFTPPAAAAGPVAASGGTPSHGHSMTADAPPAAAPAPSPAPQLMTKPGTITSRQVVKLNETFAAMPVRGHGQAYARARVARALVMVADDSRTGIAALTDLSEAEAAMVLDALVGSNGVATARRILLEDGAGEQAPHLVPPAPEQPDPVPGPVVDPGGALNDHDGPNPSGPEGGAPDDDVDPTTDPSWGQHPAGEVPDDRAGGEPDGWSGGQA